jgi:hypothetical protein
MSNSTTIPVYCMPGMAANSLIFQYIKLPAPYQLFYLDWIPPRENESLQSYALRMCDLIKEPLPILLGVSFGGILVQEMAKIIEVRKTVIVSSIKSNKELPITMKLGKLTKAYKILPTQYVDDMESLMGFVFGPAVKRRMDLHKKYLSVRDKHYLDWAIEQMTEWKQETPPSNLIHIHGTLDLILPVLGMKNYIPVPKATHAMILTKAAWFNTNLPKLLC